MRIWHKRPRAKSCLGACLGVASDRLRHLLPDRQKHVAVIGAICQSSLRVGIVRRSRLELMEAGMSRLSFNSALEATRMKLALLDADVRHLLLPRKCCCSESSTHETAFLEMARYNAWANVRLYKMAGALPEELYRREIVSFIQFVLWHIRCGKSKCHDGKILWLLAATFRTVTNCAAWMDTAIRP